MSPMRTARKLSPKSGHAMSQEVLRPPVPAPALSLTLPPDGREARVAHVRESLLKHIHCVQQEIARLQDERHKLPCAAAQVQGRAQEEEEAVCRLQHWWRSKRKAKEGSRRLSKKIGENGSTVLRPRHFAAARIQRWFRIYRWRRRFVEVSVQQIGWLGSLAWLQEEKRLYGTELADSEDVRWWSEQRAAAPLDREVDPWGALKLREHLDKMWYGHTNENIAEEEELLLLRHHQQKMQRKQKPRLQQPSRAQPKLQKQTVWQISSRQNLHAAQAVSLEAPVAKSRPVGAELSSVRVTQRGLSATIPKNCKSSSLSPRFDVRIAKHTPGLVRNGIPPRAPAPGSTAAPTRAKSPVTRPGTSWAPNVIASTSRPNLTGVLKP